MFDNYSKILLKRIKFKLKRYSEVIDKSNDMYSATTFNVKECNFYIGFQTERVLGYSQILFIFL